MNLKSVNEVSKIISHLKETVKCPICLDCIQKCSQLQCGHQFCKDCITEHWKTSAIQDCPMCKKTFKKRQKCHENWLVDELSNFLNSVSNIFSTKEVESHSLKNPQEEPSTSKKGQSVTCENETNKENAFDKLLGKTRICYINKRKLKPVAQPVLHFQNSNTRSNIINWLNETNEKLDIFSQKSQNLEPQQTQNFNEIDLPVHRERSQSECLNSREKFREPLLQRYQSLSENLDCVDNYKIEDANSEHIMQQVERKVIQNMLEDECLDDLECFANEAVPKPDSSNKISRKSEENNGSPSNLGATGWERIKNVKKTIKKAAKIPKKLSISLQSETKAEPQRKSKRKRPKSLEENHKQSKKLKETRTDMEVINNKLKNLEPHPKETKTYNLSAVESYFLQNMNKDVGNTSKHNMSDKSENDKEVSADKRAKNLDPSPLPKDIKTFNLSAVESYFLQNINNVQGNTTDVDSPLRISKRNLNKQKAKYLEVETINFNVKDDKKNDKPIEELSDDEIFLMPTQKSDAAREMIKSTSSNETKTDEVFHSKFDFVPKVLDCQNSVDSVLQLLGDNLEKCVQRTLEIEDPIPNSLLDCFLNLKSYVVKAQEIRMCKEDCGVQVCTKIKHVGVETEKIHFFDQNVQTSQTLNQSDKNVQTSQKAIGDKNMFTESQIIVSQKSQTFSSKESQRILNMSTPIVTIQKNIKSHLDTPVLNSILEKMDVDDTKSDKDKSQDSVLVCTAPSTKKISRKLTFGDTSTNQKKFKRIKKPADDDSDDENDDNKGSKQFIRDDLTIKFVDTQTNNMDTETEKTPENFDYDEYLDKVMQKYGNSPKNKAVEIINKIPNKIKDCNKKNLHNSQVAGPSRSLITTRHSNLEKFESSDKRQNDVKKSQDKIVFDDIDNHIFTADNAFQENLDKFDREIAECKELCEEINTESNDIVENTPTEDIISLKSKISTSNKQKNCELPKIHVLTKNKVINEKNKVSTPDEIQNMLEDIKNDASFFTTNMESQLPEKKVENIHQSESMFKNSKLTEKPQNDIGDTETFCEVNEEVKFESHKEKDKHDTIKPGTFEDNTIFGDDLIDAELEKISFTAEQIKAEKQTKKINVLGNLKVKSQNKIVETDDMVIDESDEDCIDKTPEKKDRSIDRSVMANIDNLLPMVFDDNHFEDTICLPPPPGFDDDFENNSPKRDAKKSPTQAPLTELIVTPDTCASPAKEHDENVPPFNLSLVLTGKTPKTKSASNHSTPRSQFKEMESLHFSPIVQSQTSQQTTNNPIVSKLSTKKTTLMTSAPNQKSILNYIKPSQELSPRPQRIPCLTSSRLIDKDMSCFTRLEVRKLVTFTNSWTPHVTHLVVLVDEKGCLLSHTAKYLLALAHSAWVVRYEWVQDCSRQGKLLPEEPYEVLDICGVPGPKIARLNRVKNPLFKDYRFFCAPPFQIIPKSDIETVVKNLGAEVVTDIRQLKKYDRVCMILTDTTATEEVDRFEELLEKHRVVTVDVEWLTKSVGQYKLMNVRPFLLCSDENIHNLGYPEDLVETVPFTLTEGTM